MKNKLFFTVIVKVFHEIMIDLSLYFENYGTVVDEEHLSMTVWKFAPKTFHVPVIWSVNENTLSRQFLV